MRPLQQRELLPLRMLPLKKQTARGLRLMRTRRVAAAQAQKRVSCTHMEVFPFLFCYLYSNAISLLAQTQAIKSRRAEDSRRPLGLRTSTRGRGRC